MSAMRFFVIASFLVVGAASASAQRSRATPACRVNTKAAWYVKQHAWFDDSRHTWSDDTLRRRLLQSVGLSEGAGVASQSGLILPEAESARVDTSMITTLRTLAATRGSVWPTRSVVGGRGVRAVWLLALRDTALARATLKRMMEAGPDESSSADVATLEDRVRLASGRKQIYGTQLVNENGALRLAPMEDSAHVELRRDAAGLPPLAYSLCVARGSAPRH